MRHRLDHRQAECFLIIINQRDKIIRLTTKLVLALKTVIGLNAHASGKPQRLDDFAHQGNFALGATAMHANASEVWLTNSDEGG